MRSSRPSRAAMRPRKQDQRYQLARSIHVEQQMHDASFTSVMTAAFQVQPISLIPQGDGYNQRDGTIVNPVHLRVSGSIQCYTDTSSTIRMIIGRTKYDQASLAVTDAVNPTAGVGYNVYSAYNRDFTGQSGADRRLKILVDKLWSHCNTFRGRIDFTFDIPLKGIIRFLESNASNYPVDGGLAIWFCDDSAGNHCTLKCQSRLIFTDA